MNIITADFNWIAFMIVIIGVVIGIVKSNGKKVEQKAVFTFDDEYEDESENTINIQDSHIENQHESELVTSEENPVIVNPTDIQEEQQFETKSQFDIRQAIISSEILNRPNF